MTGEPDGLSVRLRRRLRGEMGQIAAALGADVVTALVYDEETARFHLPVGHGLWDPDTFEDLRLGPLSGRVAGKIVRERRPIIAEQVPGHSPMDGPFARRERIWSVAGFPLLHGGVAVGVLFVSYREAHTFDADQQEKILAETERLARVVGAMAPWEELRRLPEPKGPGNDPTLQAIVELTSDAMNLSVAIWQLHPDGETLTLVAGTGLTRRYLHEARARVGDGGWLSQIVRGDGITPLVLDNLQADVRFPFKEAAAVAGWVAALGLPVRSHGRICGVVEGLGFGPSIDPGSRDVLRRLADLAGVTIENAQRQHEAHIMGKVAQELSQAPDFGRAMQVIVDGALKLTGADSGGIYRLDESKKPFVLFSQTSRVRTAATCCLPTGLAPAGQAGYEADRRVLSQVEVPIRMEEEPIDTLYVCGHLPRQFTDHHRMLMQTLAEQVSLALRWPRLLLKASTKIERESVRLFDQEKEFAQVIKEIQQSCQPCFDFVALQLIHPGERVIETVRGLGPAAEWEGRAKHYLEPDEMLRDIQADIALASPPRTEVLTRNDPRFDKWIFETFRHHNFVRAFVPLVLARDADGKVLVGEDMDDWLHAWGLGMQIDVKLFDDRLQVNGRRQAVELALPKVSARKGALSWEVIGTIEAGYVDCEKHTIKLERAVELTKSAARLAVRIYRTLLQHVFQTVVDHAVRIVGAKHASLHFYRPSDADHPAGGSYVYQVSSGQLAKELLKHYPPREGGLGQQAIEAGRAMFIPDPAQNHDDLELQHTNPNIWAMGIRAMAAIPLLVELKREAHAASGVEMSSGSEQGVLYVGFGEEAGDGPDKVHHFTSEEIGWLQLFANSAANAIRHATAYTQMRDQARLLANLHSVAKSLVSIPEDPDLLRHIAWNVLNILGADVVTIYHCVQSEGYFINPPAVAGRLCDELAMNNRVGPADIPGLLVIRGHVDPIYSINSCDDPLLNPERPERKRLSFVKRERIASSAAVPLVTGEDKMQEVVGILFVNYRRPHFFPDEEKKVIETLASTAAVAIKNGRLLCVFRDADYRIIATQDVDQVLDRIVNQAVEFTRAEYGEIRLFDPLRQCLTVQCRHPANADEGEVGADHPWQRAVENWVLANCEDALIRDYRKDDRCTGARVCVGSECCVPLVRDRQCLGVLRVASRAPDAFQPRHQSVLVGFANRAVIALLTDGAQKRLKTNEKLSTLGGLTGTLLHRLKNDLLGISFLSDQLKEAEGAGDVPKALAMANRVVALTETFRKQVSRLRDWSESDCRLVLPHDAVMQGYRMVSVPDHVKVEINVPAGLPPVLGDAALLAELFSILMKNAVEAMPNGGRLLIYGQSQGLLNASWIVVRVQDTGTGIDDLTLERLFQPKHSAKRGGLGIGLWLAHSYIELLGGRLRVETEVGQGSTFIVGLPAAVLTAKA